MEPFEFKCRATKIEPDCKYCKYGESLEPNHNHELSRCIADVKAVTEGLRFTGRIKSRVNAYQVDLEDFDSAWKKRIIKNTSWQCKRLNINNINELKNTHIKPDSLIINDSATVVVEIEKANKNNIWFDFVKIMAFITVRAADFGLLLVPRNYAHSGGIWNLFDEARCHRWWLIKFAGVSEDLFSKIAIIGYTQQALIDGNWASLDTHHIKTLKNKAQDHFRKNNAV